ncbi:hypothetical protein F4561_000280 [Lipingzhangella halophila]|uniref:Uncharacterized protein n=1 Tax=Lipingzhangella halophila TaxID=1783352 RepID=A0A7W7W192_9ACTN|nr:hypothetical protein [Lipingzhangella halophila]MBB4929460.1 hypothetical protein [Lipingzhangella halophila]
MTTDPQPPEVSWARKLISPSGLLLVLLCLFLPFVGVSCETGLGTLRVQASGWDLAVNGQPSVSGSAASSDTLRDLAGSSGWSEDERVGAHILMLIGILTLLTGLVLCTILQSVRARALAGLSASCGAAALFAVNEVVVLIGLDDRIEEQAGWAGNEIAGGTRYGFWVTLAVLLVIAGYNLVELLRARRPAAPASGPPPGHGPLYAQGPNPPPWPPVQQPYPYPQSHPAPPYPGQPPGSYGGSGPYGQYGPYGPYGPHGPPRG